MSRRGNCWDNAVAESFFNSLKKERVRKRVYKTRDMARADIFDCIEVFSTTEIVVTTTSVVLAPKLLSGWRREASKCLKSLGSPNTLNGRPLFSTSIRLNSR